MLYLPPDVICWVEPAIERRKQMCLAFGNAFLTDVFEEYIRENLSSALSISDIGRACGMSTRNVARVFKQATGGQHCAGPRRQPEGGGWLEGKFSRTLPMGRRHY